MAEYSGFFNAVMNGGVPDRKYNANDYCDNLAAVISNGVIRGETNLKVTASGMICSVAAGRGWINGHYYYLDSTYTFAATTAPTSGSRIDRIMLRLNSALNLGDATERKISLVYVTGTAATSPVAPAPTRSGNIYDLVLADVRVNASAASVTVTDQRGVSGLCDWLYSNAKGNLFMRYSWRGTLASATRTVQFSIAQYTSQNGYIEVYVNGILSNAYTQNGTILTFTNSLTAGTVVTVHYIKSIDGTGVESVASAITTLQNQVAALNGVARLVYKCTGLNDNISLSQIAQAIYAGSYTVGTLNAAAEAFLSSIGGNTWLASLRSDAQITIEVSGTCGATTPYSGTGLSANRYKWFELGLTTVNDKKLIFDFAKCDIINITPVGNKNHIIFFGVDLYIKNCRALVQSAEASCIVTMIKGANMFGRMEFTDCVFKLVTTGKAIMTKNGTFVNCILHAKSSTDHCYIFDAETESCIQVLGGTFFAYTGSGMTTKYGSVFNIESTETNGVIMAQAINCPVIAQSGYKQDYLIRSIAGMCQIMGVTSTLGMTGNALNYGVTGRIQKNKH